MTPAPSCPTICIKWNDFETNAAVTEPSGLNDIQSIDHQAQTYASVWSRSPSIKARGSPHLHVLSACCVASDDIPRRPTMVGVVHLVDPASAVYTPGLNRSQHSSFRHSEPQPRSDLMEQRLLGCTLHNDDPLQYGDEVYTQMYLRHCTPSVDA